MLLKPRLPIHSLYAFGVLLFGIVALALVYFCCHIIYYYFSVVGVFAMETLGTNSSNTALTVALFNNVDTYIIIFGLIVLVVWALRYSQKRGAPIYE